MQVSEQASTAASKEQDNSPHFITPRDSHPVFHYKAAIEAAIDKNQYEICILSELPDAS